MKKSLTKMIPLTLLVLALCMSSVAVSANTVAISNETHNNGTVSMDVTYTADTDGQVVVLVVDGDQSENPNYLASQADMDAFKNEIVYLDQAGATAGETKNFTFLLNNNATEDAVTLYASGTDVAPIAMKALPLAAAERYNVSLVTNGGTIASGKDVTSYTKGTAVALPNNTEITKTGYTFEGWFENAECTGSAVTEIPADAEGDKTYYAKWKLLIVAGDITVDDNTETTVGADAGYYKDATDATKYAISVTAKVNTSVIANIAKYGFVVYKDSALEVDADTLEAQEQLDANGYYTIAYGIPETETARATDICFKPFVVTTDGDVIYGAVKEYCVNDFADATTKYLGTAADLGFN